MARYFFRGRDVDRAAMGFFSAEIERAVVLALFIPLIISSGGNSGSQATTLVIRAMALGEIRLRDWFRVIRRELAAGVTLGSILGVIGISRIILWHTLRGTYGPHYLVVALTIGCSLVGVVMFGTTAGFHAALYTAALRARSRKCLSSVRRNPGRCYGIDYLFLGRECDFEGNHAVGVKLMGWSAGSSRTLFSNIPDTRVSRFPRRSLSAC